MSKELKNVLRLTKESIDQQQYEEALKHLKKALKIDASNYHVFMFAGFCSQKLDRSEAAEQAYRKATEIDPNNPQAWIGLSELYPLSTLTQRMMMPVVTMTPQSHHHHQRQQQEKQEQQSNMDLLESCIRVNMRLVQLLRDQTDRTRWKTYAHKLTCLFSLWTTLVRRTIMTMMDMKKKMTVTGGGSSGQSSMSSEWNQTQERVLNQLIDQCKIDNDTVQQFRYMTQLLPLSEQREKDMTDQMVQQALEDHVQSLRNGARQKLMGKKSKLSSREIDQLMPRDDELISEQEKRELRESWTISKKSEYITGNHDLEFDRWMRELIQMSTDNEKLLIPIWYQERYIQRLYDRFIAASDEQAERQLKQSVMDQCDFVLKRHGISFYAFYLQLMFSEEDDSVYTDDYVRSIRLKVAQCYPYEGLSSIILYELYPAEQQRTEYELEVLLQRGLKECPDYIQGWIDFTKLFYDQKRYIKSAQCALFGVNQVVERSQKRKSKLRRLHVQLLNLQALSLTRTNQVEEAEAIYNKVLNELDQKNIDAIKGLGEVEFGRHNYTKARELYQRVLDINPSDATSHGQVAWMHFLDHEYEEAIKCLNKAIELDASQYIFHYRLGRCYWSLGGEYRRNKNFAQTSFLTSAKLNPHYASSFTYLGMYFEEVAHDIERAIKCYLKAVGLNALEVEAGERVSELYASRRQRTLLYHLLLDCTANNPRAKWAWKRLGFLQQALSKYQDSTLSFQSALRVDSRDALCWQGLADTYQREGKYLAALKAYNRARELNPGLVYSIASAAYIHYLLQEYSDARRTYEQAIHLSPHFITAYKGLAETTFQMAVNSQKDGLFVKSAHNLMKAIATLRASSNYPCTHMQSYWKLFGDICTFFANLPNESVIEAYSHYEATLASSNLPQFYLTSFDKRLKNRLDYLAMGSVSYQHLINLDPAQSDNWYDLGVNLGTQAHIMEVDNQVINPEHIELLNKQAASAYRCSISINPNNALYWNGLGCVETHPAVKQHCFIRAIQQNPKACAPWNNLGLLYVRNAKYHLAKEAFVKAQTLDPASSVAWTGLAVLNEIAGKKTGLERAVSDFKHAVYLEKTAPATLGLAYTAFLKGEYLPAYQSLLKYLQYDKQNPDAWNIYGLCLEKLNRCTESESAFRQSIKLLDAVCSKSAVQGASLTEVLSGWTFNTDSISFQSVSSLGYTPENRRSICQLNLARVLNVLGSCQEAYDIYKQYESVLHGDVGIATGLAVASYNLGKHTESVSYLSKLLTESSKLDRDDRNKKQLLLILAKLYYSIRDFQNAKATLEQCMKLYPQDPNAYHQYAALSALTLPQNPDVALKVIHRIHDKLTHYSDVGTYILESNIHLFQNRPLKARNTIQKALFLYPHRPELWDALATISLRMRNMLAEERPQKEQHVVAKSTKKRSQAPNYEAEFAMCESAVTPDILSHIVVQMLQTSMSKLTINTFKNDITALTERLYNIAMLYYTMGIAPKYHNARVSVEYSLRLAQKVLMYDPSHMPTRELIAACSHSLAQLTRKETEIQNAKTILSDYLSMASHVSHHRNAQSLLPLHVALCEDYILSRDYSQCVAHVKQLMSEPTLSSNPLKNQTEAVLYAVLAVCVHAKGDEKHKYFKLFENSLRRDAGNIATWMRMADIFLNEHRYRAAELCLTTALKTLEKSKVEHKPQKFIIYAKLAYMYLQSLYDQNDADNHDRYAEEGVTCIKKALKLNNQSPVAYLLYGKLCFLLQDNARATFAFRKATELDNQQPLNHLSLYKVHYQAENWESAENELWAERDIQPTSAFLYYSLASFAFESNAYEPAFAFIQKAILLEPHESFYWETLANIEAAMKPATKKGGGQKQQQQQQQPAVQQQNAGIPITTKKSKGKKK